MCTFITTVVPDSADEDFMRTSADAWGLGWDVVHNRHVAAQLRNAERHYSTTRKYCDCDTPLGSLGSFQRGRQEDPTEKIPLLRKRGWSEAKIARWLEDKGRAAGHRRRAAAMEASQPPMGVEVLGDAWWALGLVTVPLPAEPVGKKATWTWHRPSSRWSVSTPFP